MIPICVSAYIIAYNNCHFHKILWFSSSALTIYSIIEKILQVYSNIFQNIANFELFRYTEYVG